MPQKTIDRRRFLATMASAAVLTAMPLPALPMQRLAAMSVPLHWTSGLGGTPV